VHTQENFLSGENRITLQYGTGSSRGAVSPLFEGKTSIGRLTTAARAENLKKAVRFASLNSTLSRKIAGHG